MAASPGALRHIEPLLPILDAPIGTITLSGSITESLVHGNTNNDSGSGSVTVSGSIVAATIYNTSPSGTITIGSPSGVVAAPWWISRFAGSAGATDALSPGAIVVSGSIVATHSHSDVASGTLTVSGAGGDGITLSSANVTLDPPEVAIDRTQLDLTTGGLQVNEEGIDWGDAQITAYMAQLALGEVPVDYRLPNRVVTIPIAIGVRGSFDTARQNLQKKVALFQREGGWIRRNTGLYGDIVNASLVLPDHTAPAFGYEKDARLVLECLPDFYSDEITESAHTETANPELVFTEAPIAGDHPGRLRLIVSDRQAKSQLGLIWGIRSRYYDSATTAKLAYEAEALTPLDSAAAAALSGASGGNTVKHSNLSTNWTPVLSTDLVGTGPLTHRGSYRFWARVYTSSPVPPSLRLLYDVGDLTLPTENDAWTIPGSSSFYIADLGEIRIDKAPFGTHRWKGVIQARGAAGGENVWIDRVWFQPLDDGAGRLVAPLNADQGLTAASARDEFNQSAGALTGKSPAVGAAWAVVANSDSDDFAVVTLGLLGLGGPGGAQRTADTDSGTGSDILAGRGVTIGTTNQAAIGAAVDLSTSAFNLIGGSLKQGLLLRLTDSANFAAVYVASGLSGPAFKATVKVVKVVAGTVTTLYTSAALPAVANAVTTLKAEILTDGTYAVWHQAQGAPDTLLHIGNDSVFATGGTLAAGRFGIADYQPAGAGATRLYGNFAVWVPTSDAVLFASQSAELRWDGMHRYDAAGVGVGPVTEVVGDLARIPPSGLEARPVEFFVKASRGDFDQLPDSGIDDIAAQVKYRPSYLFRP